MIQLLSVHDLLNCFLIHPSFCFADLCRQLANQQSYHGIPGGYEERVKKVFAEQLESRKLSPLIKLFTNYPEKSDVRALPDMSKFSSLTSDLGGLINPSRKKRNPPRSDGRAKKTSGDSSSAQVVTSTKKPTTRTTPPPLGTNVSKPVSSPPSTESNPSIAGEGSEGSLQPRKKQKTNPPTTQSKGKEKVGQSSDKLPPPPKGTPPPNAEQLPLTTTGIVPSRPPLRANEVDKMKSGVWQPVFGVQGRGRYIMKARS